LARLRPPETASTRLRPGNRLIFLRRGAERALEWSAGVRTAIRIFVITLTFTITKFMRDPRIEAHD
jgi:hypothetical protein